LWAKAAADKSKMAMSQCAYRQEVAEIQKLKSLKTLLAAKLAQSLDEGHIQKATCRDLVFSHERRADAELVIKDGMAYVLPSKDIQCQALCGEHDIAWFGANSYLHQSHGGKERKEDSDVQVLMRLHSELAVRLSQFPPPTRWNKALLLDHMDTRPRAGNNSGLYMHRRVHGLAGRLHDDCRHY